MQFMHRSRQAGFTICELLICLTAAALVAISLATIRQRTRVHVTRSHCATNLKQIGLAFRMWANDHAERFPWRVPEIEGGTKELEHLPYAAPHYVAASNELVSPRILKCPQDPGRISTNVWNASLHFSLSYFAALHADANKPSTILAGDRNVSTNLSMMVGFLTVQDTRELQITKNIHKTFVNLAFADGSVAQLKAADLHKMAAKEMNASNSAAIRLVIP